MRLQLYQLFLNNHPNLLLVYSCLWFGSFMFVIWLLMFEFMFVIYLSCLCFVVFTYSCLFNSCVCLFMLFLLCLFVFIYPSRMRGSTFLAVEKTARIFLIPVIVSSISTDLKIYRFMVKIIVSFFDFIPKMWFFLSYFFFFFCLYLKSWFWIQDASSSLCLFCFYFVFVFVFLLLFSMVLSLVVSLWTGIISPSSALNLSSKLSRIPT